MAGADLTKPVEVDVHGEILELKETMNGMTESDKVTHVAQVGTTEGRLGGQAKATNVGGTVKDPMGDLNVVAPTSLPLVRVAGHSSSKSTPARQIL